MTVPQAFRRAIHPILAAAPAGPVGVAVSGGSDSTALLLLVRAWALEAGRPVHAVTIDHGLRPESRVEAQAVAALAARCGVAHDVLQWQGCAGRGNLQDAAREGRRALMRDWAEARGIAGIALGHTQDDQAETVLMRLARGSGVDGLSAMRPIRTEDGLVWLRPLLGLARADLRAWLAAEGVAWTEDPSNDDRRFLRVRARAALGTLAGLGLGPARLAATAARMGRARAALEAATATLAAACLTVGRAGDVTLDPRVLRDAPVELRLRCLAGTLCWVSGATYRPRLAALERALERLEAGSLGHGLTLHGCVLRPARGQVAIRREAQRVAPPAPLARRRWDARWEIMGDPPAGPDLAIGALGTAGLERVGDWRGAGIPRETLLTTPALWRGQELVAAPLLRPEARFGFRRIVALQPPWEVRI